MTVSHASVARWPQQQRTECWIVDDLGRASLSWSSADGVFSLGYSDADVAHHVMTTVERHDVGIWSSPSERREAGERAFNASLPPGLDTTVFTANTAEALEVALKLARHHTGRRAVVSAVDAGEGARSLALAVAGPVHRPERRRRVGLAIERVDFGSIGAIEHAVDDTTAAVLVESFDIDNGVREAPPGYLAAVRRLCDDHGALMVLDETKSGLLRTGTMWAFEHHDITPDLLISGNALSGGYYPIGACSGPSQVFDPAGGMSAVHASTFFGNEIAATVAGRVVGRCLDKRFQKHVARVGQQLGTGLQAIMNEHSHVVVGVRGRGMLYGVEVIDPVLRDPLIRGCARRGLICQPSGHDATVLVMPPLVISGGEVDEGLGWFEQAVARL